LSSADVAQALGITPAAFRMRVARARRRLRAVLNPTTTEERPQWSTP
jgi:DNA-directed RNA polymerase specialized sigma24 family protein